MKISSVFVLLILIFSFSSCADKKVDTAAVKAEMKEREIKVVPEAKVLAVAMEMGNSIAKKVDSVIVSNKEYENGIKANAYLFSQKPQLKGKELGLFEAYKYNAENGVRSEPNVQDLSEQRIILHTSPIYKEDILIGMLSIKLPRKTIINSIDN